MPLKLNISEKEKSWKLEVETDNLAGKSIGDKINGNVLKQELEGYELEITGGSDIAGFPMDGDIEGIGLKRVLRTRGWGMHKNEKGLRLRKTTRGKTISDKTSQVNLKVIKEGNKKLEETFPEQNKSKTQEENTTSEQPSAETA